MRVCVSICFSMNSRTAVNFTTDKINYTFNEMASQPFVEAKGIEPITLTLQRSVATLEHVPPDLEL